MARTKEGAVKAQIKKVLESFGSDLYYCMPIGTGYGNSGVPDFIVCYKGYFLAIEAKAGKGTTTALQKHHLAMINQAGGATLVIYENRQNELLTTIQALKDIVDLRRGDTP